MAPYDEAFLASPDGTADGKPWPRRISKGPSARCVTTCELADRLIPYGKVARGFSPLEALRSPKHPFDGSGAYFQSGRFYAPHQPGTFGRTRRKFRPSVNQLPCGGPCLCVELGSGPSIPKDSHGLASCRWAAISY